MIDVNLTRLLRSFRDRRPDPEQQERLYKQALLMTLSRGTHADTTLDSIEVDTVRRIIKETTGEDVSAADIRVAGASELYETAPLEKYLSRIAPELLLEQRLTIAHKLAEVLRSDTEVNSDEARFFNRIVRALDLKQLVGLVERD